MKQQDVIQQIKRAARRDARKRRDPRYLRTMGFLVAKGFLRINTPMQLLPNQRLRIEDVIWAGKNVEPRILEVLPAAILRLERHFDLDAQRHRELAQVVQQLRNREQNGNPLWEIPYEKLSVWVDIQLKDGRTKTPGERKVMKTFRMSPDAIKCLREAAKQQGCSETEFLERRLLSLA